MWTPSTSKYNTAVTGIVRQGHAFEVQTSQGVYYTERVVVAIGSGDPMKLVVPGADLQHVLGYPLKAGQLGVGHVR